MNARTMAARWRARWRMRLCCALLLCFVEARSARAQSEQEPPDYRAAIELAVSEYELGNFAEARAQFGRAHALYPNARSFRGLGMTEFELRNYRDAIADLEQALASERRPLSTSLRDETEELLQRARGYVARLALQVEPRDASVALDGVPLEADMYGRITLEVGDHVLDVRAPSRIAQRRLLKVTGGEEWSLRVALHESAPAEAPTRLVKNKWLWGAVAVVAACAGTGLAFALTRPEQTLARPEGGTTGVALAGPR